MHGGASRPGRGSQLAWALLLAAGGCAADLWTKASIFRWLGPPNAAGENIWWLWPEYVGLQTSINTGALFGLGQGRVAWFAIISLVAILAILWWLLFGTAGQDRRLSLIMGLILGGILGNFYDRLGLWGHQGVRDWILLKYHDFVWPNFNIADALLVCGAALLVWHAYRQEDEDVDSPPPGVAVDRAHPAAPSRSARSAAPPQAAPPQAAQKKP